jgi:hypothetical protein
MEAYQGPSFQKQQLVDQLSHSEGRHFVGKRGFPMTPKESAIFLYRGRRASGNAFNNGGVTAITARGQTLLARRGSLCRHEFPRRRFYSGNWCLFENGSFEEKNTYGRQFINRLTKRLRLDAASLCPGSGEQSDRDEPHLQGTEW